MTKRVNINPLLDEIIKESGLTQEEIAKELGYDRAYLSQARKEGTKKLQDKLLAFLEQVRKPKEYNGTGDTIQLLLEKISSLERELNEKDRRVNLLDELKVSLDQLKKDQDTMFDLVVSYLKYLLEHQLNDAGAFRQALRTIQQNALASGGTAGQSDRKISGNNSHREGS